MDKWKSQQTFRISEWVADPNSGYADKQYSGDNAVAITLLPILSERGFQYTLESSDKGNSGYSFQISKGSYHAFTQQATIGEAISQATLKLIADMAEGVL